MKTILACGVTLLGLAACTPTDPYARVAAQAVPPSAELKASIVQDAKEIVYDPRSVRNAQISNVATFADGTQGVCVRADVKNAQGVYMGAHNMGLRIRDGKRDVAALEHPLCERADITWQPFPELEGKRKR
ncbi:hypothetical protein QWZ10_03505 [Paracoccus cavernae]|uniref:Lipoprotein n=1 Tax=Paracoccus cavernae TaxID=1571207 RepID=A0ABT8D3Z0_9RHOB|nr:hypothetical protein [Paracoccus cavernae]